MISVVVAVLLGVLTVLVGFLFSTQDANEPPLVDAHVPFLSALVRMGWAGVAYWGKHVYVFSSLFSSSLFCQHRDFLGTYRDVMK